MIGVKERKDHRFEMDTLLPEPDITEHGDDILSVAPGEGQFSVCSWYYYEEWCNAYWGNSQLFE